VIIGLESHYPPIHRSGIEHTFTYNPYRWNPSVLDHSNDGCCDAIPNLNGDVINWWACIYHNCQIIQFSDTTAH